MLTRPQFLFAALWTVLLGCCLPMISSAQKSKQWADSIRIAYHIPELAYAVVDANSIIELSVLGEKIKGAGIPADINDHFRIGSNTKAITGMIAQQLVQENKISWHSKFFDLFPELKAQSRPEYAHYTLLDLLSFRTRLYPYTYTDHSPKQEYIKGNAAQQRYAFTQWFLAQKPVKKADSIHFSNVGYTAAGLMLEKVSGKSYQELVQALGNPLQCSFAFGNPNSINPNEPWGHDAHLHPEAPGKQYKLDWLLAAGNINVSLPDYCRFIQVQLQGLAGQSTWGTQQSFEWLHYGCKTFAIGWFWDTDKQYGRYSYNVGNPGAFLSKVLVYGDQGKAFIVFANVQSDAAEEGMDLLIASLKHKYLN
jgi:CubicO group peptidase (beta-lactamase class C family)